MMLIHNRQWYIDRVLAPAKRFSLRNKNFSLIANTCLGVSFYHKYNLPYLSPTIGTLIVTEDYLRMLEDLKYYMQQPLHFIKEPIHKPVMDCHKYKYPIGILGEGANTVEIQFPHEKSEADAYSKWTRRTKRIDFDNLFITMTDSANIEFSEPPFNMSHVHRFEALPFKNKVLFSHLPIDSPSVVYIANNMKGIHVVENMMYNRKFEKWMNVTAWLNGLGLQKSP